MPSKVQTVPSQPQGGAQRQRPPRQPIGERRAVDELQHQRARAIDLMLQNDARVPPAVAAAAQAEVVRLFELADIELEWLTTVPPPGIRLRVISLVTWEPREEEMASVPGLTYGEPPCATCCTGPAAGSPGAALCRRQNESGH